MPDKQKWSRMRPFYSCFRVLLHRYQHEDRNFAGCLLPVIVKAGHDLNHLVVQAGPLRFFRDLGACLEFLRPDFNCHQWIRHQVVIPIRIGRRSAFGCDDHQVTIILTYAVGLMRSCPLLAPLQAKALDCYNNIINRFSQRVI